MKQIPIPYTEVMVKSLLQNLKTMTRRTGGLERVNENPDDWKIVSGDWLNSGVLFFNKNGHSDRMKPKYQVGDQLWVKETYTILEPEHCEGMTKRFYYKADHHEANEEWRKECISKGYPYKWITGRFMPKAAARIWIEVTDIKCERLQDISPKDCISEGIEKTNSVSRLNRWKDYLGGIGWMQPITSFQSLWASINGYDEWDQNPWVFVYTFKRIDKPDD